MAVGLPLPKTAPRWPAFLTPLAAGGFRAALAGRTCALLAEQAQPVVLAAIALDLTRSAAGWGAVLAAQAIPRVLLTLVGGVASDRYRPGAVLRVVGALQAVGLAWLAALHAGGGLSLPHLYGFALVAGALGAFASPASESMVPALLPVALLRAGNVLWSLALNVGRFVGPPLAGVLLVTLGVEPALAAVGAASALGGALFGLAGAAPAGRRPTGSPLPELGRGLVLAWRDRAVGAALLLLTAFNLGYAGAVLVGLPTLARLELGAGDMGTGILLGVHGGGALLGALAIGLLPAARRLGLVACAATIGVGGGLAAAGLAPSLWTAAPALALSGACVAATAVALKTLLQTRAPAEARGRVMALFSLALSGLSPLSYGLAGVVADAIGARGVLILGGACVAAAGLLGLGARELRRAE